jgi:hypothetical protein
MWAGSADGLVHVTTDAGATWKLVTPPALPQWAQISSIEPAHDDRATAYLTASRYMWDDFHPYVYKTTDYGAHWTQITDGLPNDQYVFAIRQEPRNARVMFAGTRSTVYVSLDGGARWQSLTLNLPGVQVRDIAIDARQGAVAIATHGRAFWILDNLRLLEQLADQAPSMDTEARLYTPETAWLTYACGNPASPAPSTGVNPKCGATVFFNLPTNYNGKAPLTLSFLDAQGKVVRTFALHLRDKHEKKPSAEALLDMDHATQIARDLHDATNVDPGMNAFTWNMRFAPATEVRDFRMPTADDIDDGVNGPTVLPGTYTVALDYDGKTLRQPLRIELDPRFHPEPGALEARLALALQIEGTLDRLNQTINAARTARAGLAADKRARLDGVLDESVQMDIHSSEGDLLHQVKLRDHLAFLMNELDMSFDKPTAAEESAFQELQQQANAAVEKMRTLTTGN